MQIRKYVDIIVTLTIVGNVDRHADARNNGRPRYS